MSSMAVCLAVGAISFVRCEFSARPTTLLQPSHHDHIYAEKVTPRPNPSGSLGLSNPPSLFKREKTTYPRHHLTRDFRHLKHIYDQCKTRVTKRLKKMMKTRPSWHLPELKAYVWYLYQCVKVYGFRALDQVLEDNFIPVTDYVYFVKDGINGTEDFPSPPFAPEEVSAPLKEYAPRVLSRHWTALLYDRIRTFLRTHSLKLRLDETLIPQGRSRRRDHRMFAMMVMGFMIMASILIPMGFQFLTVLGGKSLLLAKMALIMSAINGLKKIATSNVGYGFYHTPTDAHHHDHLHHGFHEKHFHLNPNNYNQLQGYN